MQNQNEKDLETAVMQLYGLDSVLLQHLIGLGIA